MFTTLIHEDSYSAKKFLIWTAFSFQAGCINVGGFLACHRFVTHTTGFATLFGAEMAEGNVKNALGYLAVPFLFLLGSMFSAFFTDRRSLHQHKPNYIIVFAGMWICFLLVSILGVSNYFGDFGNDLNLSRDFLLLALLSLASGIQNAMITSVSKAVVRTTHLTGLTTDLGIGLIRIFSSPLNQHQQMEFLATLMRLGIIVSFILGSWLAASIFNKHHYLGFFIPLMMTSIFLGMSINNRFQKNKEN